MENKKKIIFIVLTVIISLLFCEVALRCMVYFAKGRDFYHFILLKNKGGSGKFDSKLPFINKWGFPGNNFTLFKNINTYRILCLGGSAVYGDPQAAQSWPLFLEQLLRDKYSNTNFEVINAGVPGYTSMDEVIYLKSLILLNPDLIIVYDGWNDAYYSHYANAEYSAFNKKHADILKPENEFTEILKASFLINSLKSVFDITKIKIDGLILKIKLLNDKKQKEPLFTNIYFRGKKISYPAKNAAQNNLDFYIRNLKYLYRLAKSNDIKILIIIQPDLLAKNNYKHTAESEAIAKKTTGKLFDDWSKNISTAYPFYLKHIYADPDLKNIDIIDGNTAFSQMQDKFFVDMVHQNKEGMRAIAEGISNIINSKYLTEIK